MHQHRKQGSEDKEVDILFASPWTKTKHVTLAMLLQPRCKGYVTYRVKLFGFPDGKPLICLYFTRDSLLMPTLQTSLV